MARAPERTVHLAVSGLGKIHGHVIHALSKARTVQGYQRGAGLGLENADVEPILRDVAALQKILHSLLPARSS